MSSATFQAEDYKNYLIHQEKFEWTISTRHSTSFRVKNNSVSLDVTEFRELIRMCKNLSWKHRKICLKHFFKCSVLNHHRTPSINHWRMALTSEQSLCNISPTATLIEWKIEKLFSSFFYQLGYMILDQSVIFLAFIAFVIYLFSLYVDWTNSCCAINWLMMKNKISCQWFLMSVW